MKTLIVYASKYGATEKCAQEIASRLGKDAMLFDLAANKKPDLSAFDGVIVGTPVYMGRPHKEITRFLRANEQALSALPLGLFVCCIQDMNQSLSQQIDAAFPKALREHARVIGALGGMVSFQLLKGFDRLLMNMIAGDLRRKSGGDVVSTLSHTRIEQFVNTFLQASP